MGSENLEISQLIRGSQGILRAKNNDIPWLWGIGVFWCKIQVIRKFKALGYSGPFSGGKHQFMVKGPKKIRIPNPHGTGDIHVSLIKEILQQAGISNDEWDRA